MKPDNRRIRGSWQFLWGLAAGVVCYLIAEWLTPREVGSPHEHDILLANRIGFVYATVVAFWLAWLQRSWLRAILGVVVGPILGLVYMWLCTSGNILAVMIGFPCLLGGVLAALLGSNRSLWLGDLGARLGKGLLAGLVLGVVYALVLNVAGALLMPLVATPDAMTAHYVAMMWRAGPIALGVSSGLFFPLVCWAVGLSRARLLVLEHVEPPVIEADRHASES